jgi:hypothetical protein
MAQPGWPGMSQIGIRAKSMFTSVSDVSQPVGGWGHQNWYQSQGFDTEPGWAMVVVNETNISE